MTEDVSRPSLPVPENIFGERERELGMSNELEQKRPVNPITPSCTAALLKRSDAVDQQNVLEK